MTVAKSSQKPGSPRTGRMRRGYVFTVSALAAFAVALMVQRDMTADYTATAMLTTTPSAEGADHTTQTSSKRDPQLRDLERALRASDMIRSAASDAGITLAGITLAGIDAEPDAESSRKLSVESLRQQLQVRPVRQADGETTVHVSWTGTDARSTIGLVNALARQAVRQLPQRDSQALAEQQEIVASRRAVATAARDVADAKRKRDAFMAENERLLNMPMPAAGPELPAQETAAATEDSQQTTDRARQRAVELDRRLEELQRVRRQLLTSMTPEHPHFQLVRDQIAQLQAEIEETNRSIPAAKVPPRDTVGAQALALRQQQQQRQQQSLEHLALLETAAATAKARQEEAGQKLSDAERLAAGRIPAELWQVEPAQSAHRVPRRTTPAAFLLALTLAAAAGSATLLLGGATRLIERAADVERLLGVPLLASLADAGEPLPGRARGAHRPSRWILLASEATLALFLVAMVVVALANHDFATQLASDPLAALAEGVRRLPATFGGPVL